MLQPITVIEATSIVRLNMDKCKTILDNQYLSTDSNIDPVCQLASILYNTNSVLEAIIDDIAHGITNE